MRKVMYAVLLAIISWAGTVADTVVLAQDLPPTVVKTVPQSGQVVDATVTRSIAVTFSQDMLDRSWSWVQASPNTFPKIVGQPRYLADKRTCLVDVALSPGRSYVIWINSERFGNFKSAKGQPAVPYLLEFKTK